MSLKDEFRFRLLSGAGVFSRPSNGSISNLPENARILLLRPDHIGDILLSTPVLSALKTAMPKSHLSYMVGPWSRSVAANNGRLDDVLTCEFPGFDRQSEKKSIIAPYQKLFREAAILKRMKFDAAINLRFDFWWGAMLTHFAGIPVRIGYNVRECLPFLSTAIEYVAGDHEVRQNLRLLGVLGLGNSKSSGGCPGLEFNPTAEDLRFADEWLKANTKRGLLVNLHPGSGASVKLWTNDGYAALANHLVSKYATEFLVSGSSHERAMVDDIVKRIEGRAHSIVGMSLGQLAAIQQRCALAVGVDSGPMHLAVAMGTPSVHLYGPVSEKTFGPWGDPKKHVVITSSMDCIPCNRLDYRDSDLTEHPCVRRIEVGQVIEVAEHLLDCWVNTDGR